MEVNSDSELPGFWNKFSSSMNDMRKNSFLTDVVLVCGDRQFEAHRCHLSAVSPYFYTMFSSGLRESIERCVDFPSIEPEVLAILLEILYTGHLPSVELDILPKLLLASHLLQLDSVFLHYRDAFLKHLTASNFMLFWDVGEALEDEMVLSAVYNIVSEIYNDEEFKSLSPERMRRLTSHLSAGKYSSHDLLLEVLRKWTCDQEDTRLNFFAEYLESVNFAKVSSVQMSRVLSDSLVCDSRALNERIVAMALDTFRFISSLEAMSDWKEHVVSLFLLGQDDDDIFHLQKCRMGHWGEVLSLKPSETDNVVVVTTGDSRLNVITVEKENAAFLNIYDTQGERKERVKLGPVHEKAVVIAAQVGPNTIMTEYVPGNLSALYDLIIYSDNEVYHYYEGRDLFRTLRRQLLSDSRRLLYEVRQYEIKGRRAEATSTGNNDALHLTTFPGTNFAIHAWEVSPMYRDHQMSLIHSYQFRSDTTTSDWFAYLTPTHVVIRFFPGKSLHCNVVKEEFEERSENNDLGRVLAVDVRGNTAWCLTEDGTIYIQDLRFSDSSWRMMTRPSTPLKTYKGMVVLKP